MKGSPSVAIVGLGLIGGSIALRLSERGWNVGWIDPEVEPLAVEGAGSLLRSLDAGKLAEQDLVILSTPTGAAIELLDRLSFGDAVVTSVCSIMKPLVAAAEGRSIRFVAGHPMAGREVRGWQNALPSLFQGRSWFRAAVPDESVGLVDRVIHECGAEPVPVEPEEHDRWAAFASHLPQLLSSSLAALIEESRVPEPFHGEGLRTFLRLAGSSWSVWEPVFDWNAEALEEARRDLDAILARVELGEGEAVFREANSLHRRLFEE